MFNGARLKQLRLEKKLTQSKLAQVITTSHATINRYEKGVNEPDSETINNFANYFSVTTDYLLGRTDNRDNIEQVSDVVHYNPELQELCDILKQRKEMQVLFKQIKKYDFKKIQQIIRIIKAIEEEKESD